MTYDYKADTYKATEAMQNEARRGLDWVDEHGRGGTSVGRRMAGRIADGTLTEENVRKINAYFPRHEVDKEAEGWSPGEDGYPSNGRIAWALWGGDAGRSFAGRIVDRLDGEKSMEYQRFELKNLTYDIKKEPDADGTFEGYASVFDIVDQGMDVVSPGAFRRSLDAGRKIKMLWQHDQQQPIGVFDEVREDERGLFVKGRISKDVQKGREAMALMRMGALDSMSIGYRTKEATQEGNGRVRRLNEVDLFEISLVTFPMLPAATITDVKSVTTEREFERFLRDAGYSRKEATAIALHGFKGLTDQRDAVEDEDESEASELRGFIEQLRQLQEALTNV
jgi:HK97 family phage prohead protease